MAQARILIAEDDSEVAEVLRRLLEHDGHEVDHAEDGREAYERILSTETDFDLILCDLHMPRMTGAAFLAEVYPLIRWRTPVIVTSGVEYMIEALGELRRGAFSVLEKPWSRDALRETVARALDQREVYKRLRHLETRVEDLSRKHEVLVRQNADLFEQARMDVLTGLPNRRRLHEDLHVLDANIQRYTSRFAIALVDVDAFGRFNKQYGMDVGDHVLRLVSGTLRDACRQGDVVYRAEKQVADPAYRLGGDEFVLILASQTIDHAVTAMDRIRDHLARVQEEGAKTLPKEHVTISVGVVANSPDARLTIEEMLLEANEQLIAAKRAGGDCVRPALPQRQPPRPGGLRAPLPL